MIAQGRILKSNFVIWVLLAIVFTAHAQNYLWPTTASRHLSSSFCEYRPAHYHSAIDIKTWNREGYPVFAIDDGEIYRIRISPFGYGKVLYLKLKDGHYAVYAHLKKFVPKIERAVFRQQLKKMRYSIDWYPKNWPVKRGELLAYTGQTGIGVPHLHFEIRDSLQHPLNPLAFYKGEIKDTIAPILQELLVIPLTAQSTVNGSHLPRIIPLIKDKNHHYRLQDSLSASGTIGLALRSYDLADGVYNKFTYYQTHLFWDGKEVFNVSYDTLDFAKTLLADVEIYYPFKSLLHKRFRKLFIEPFNTLPFYHRSPGNGYLHMAGTNHRFRLVVRDFFGNTSVIQSKIRCEFVAAPKIRFVKKTEGNVFLKITVPSNVHQIAFRSSADGKTWHAVDYFEVMANAFLPLGYHSYVIKAQLKDTNATELQLTLRRSQGAVQICRIPLNDSCAVPKFARVNIGKRFVLLADGFKCCQNFGITARLQSGEFALPADVQKEHCEIVLPPPVVQSDSVRLNLTDFDSTFFRTAFAFDALFPCKEQTFSFYKGRLRLRSQAQTVYDTLLFTLQKNDLFLPVNRIPILSAAYVFDWYPQIFRKSAELIVRVDSVPVYWRQVGICRSDSHGKISFIGGKTDSIRGTVSARIKTLGDFIVAADTSAPEVEILQPPANAIIKKSFIIRFHLVDSLSGIDSDRDIRIFVDNKQLIPEWDPERHVVIARPYWELKSGPHTLNIIVADRVGNRTQKSVKFYIGTREPE